MQRWLAWGGMVCAGLACASSAVASGSWEHASFGTTLPLWYEYRASVNDAGLVAATEVSGASPNLTMNAKVIPLSGPAQTLSVVVAGESGYTNGYAMDLSADRHVVGFRAKASPGERRALRWIDQSGTWIVDDLHASLSAPFPGHSISAAYSISERVGNERVAVGYVREAIQPSTLSQPIAWTLGETAAGTSVHALPKGSADYGLAYGVSEPGVSGRRVACGGVGMRGAFLEAACWDLTVPSSPTLVSTPTSLRIGATVATSVVNRVRTMDVGSSGAPQLQTIAVGYYVQGSGAVAGFVWNIDTGVVDIHTALATDQDAILSDITKQSYTQSAGRANAGGVVYHGPLVVGTGTTGTRLGAGGLPMSSPSAVRAIAQTRIASTVATAQNAQTCNLETQLDASASFRMVSGVSRNGVYMVGVDDTGRLVRTRRRVLASPVKLFSRDATVYSSATGYSTKTYHWAEVDGAPLARLIWSNTAGCQVFNSGLACTGGLGGSHEAAAQRRAGVLPSVTYVQGASASSSSCGVTAVYAVADLAVSVTTNPAGDSASSTENWADCGANAAPAARPASGGWNIDTRSDWYHCGSCGNSCFLGAGSVTRCQNSVCLFDGCVPGYVDLDGSATNGCECPIQNGGVDTPELMAPYIDQNCDGIDGTVAQSVFVAKWGADGAACGTKEAPCLTVQQGVNRAVAQGRGYVLIGAGTYTELVTLSNGVSLYGAYGAAQSDYWQRSDSFVTRIAGVVSGGSGFAVVGSNLTGQTIVNKLTIEAPNATAVGASSYGIQCANCGGLYLSGVSVRSGHGVAGSAGASSTEIGAAGSSGNNGCCGSDDGSGSGNGQVSGGASSCGRTGGHGGRGGAEGGNGGAAGGAGIVVNNGGGSGGAGTGYGGRCSHRDGVAGGGGSGGAAPAAASGGSGGGVAANLWVSANGMAGAKGNDGHGGGGGSGGSGQGNSNWNNWCDHGAGNSAGSGGGGGCGGGGGAAGTGGGGSFAVFLVASANARIQNSKLTTGNGAVGGAGGAGNRGGDGGVGGRGGSDTDGKEIGWGGSGGGGSGGGGGAGGAGGPSVAIAYTGGTPLMDTNDYTLGVSGAGGLGGGGGDRGNAGGGGGHDKAGGLAGAAGGNGAIGNAGQNGSAGPRQNSWEF